VSFSVSRLINDPFPDRVRFDGHPFTDEGCVREGRFVTASTEITVQYGLFRSEWRERIRS
jgi:hypothetical protein